MLLTLSGGRLAIWAQKMLISKTVQLGARPLYLTASTCIRLLIKAYLTHLVMQRAFLRLCRIKTTVAALVSIVVTRILPMLLQLLWATRWVLTVALPGMRLRWRIKLCPA